MHLHWAPRIWVPRAMVFGKVVHFSQILPELENSVETAYTVNLNVSKQLSRLNER